LLELLEPRDPSTICKVIMEENINITLFSDMAPYSLVYKFKRRVGVCGNRRSVMSCCRGYLNFVVPLSDLRSSWQCT
jgi:hypothetical protein